MICKKRDEAIKSFLPPCPHFILLKENGVETRQVRRGGKKDKSVNNTQNKKWEKAG